MRLVDHASPGRGLRTARPTLSAGAAKGIFDRGPIAL